MKENKLWKKILSFGLCAAIIVGTFTGVLSGKYTAVASADSSFYAIGARGTANNEKAVSQDNEYAEVAIVGSTPESYNGSYVYNDLNQTNLYYVNVVLEYEGNIVGMSPNNWYQYNYMAFSESSIKVDINPVAGYEVAEVALKVNKDYAGEVTVESANKIAADGDGNYTCTLQKRNDNRFYTNKYTNEIRITLTEAAEVETEEEVFKANLFKYNQSEMNAASKAINESSYMSIGYIKAGAAGEWNSCQYSGAYQGLAASTLEDGLIAFPIYAAANFFSANEADAARTDYYTITETEKTSYYNVVFPFEKVGDKYEYDSAKHSATLDEDAGVVSLGDVNGGFWPFGVKNFYFGMNFVTDFYMTEDGTLNGEDIVFEFSGDDDVWVYIDGELVLDLGGIHGAIGGSINFNTGEVSFYNPGLDSAQTGVVFVRSKASYITDTTMKNNEIVQASYNFYEATSNSITKADLTDGGAHELQVYYMERGASVSNCKIQFNLPQTPQQNILEVSNTVVKTVNGEVVEDETPFTYVAKKDGEILGNVSYTFVAEDGTKTMQTTNADGTFSLKDGESAIFYKTEEGTYTVTEVLEENYTTNFIAKKNQDVTSTGGPAVKTDAVSTLEANHEITVEMNKETDKYTVDFVNTTSEMYYDVNTGKTTTLVDWNARVYCITLNAESVTNYMTENGNTLVAAENAMVVDTIDNRFELAAEEAKRLEADGAIVTVNADGTTSVIWKGQTISTEGWSKEIHIQAKADYIGGNDIATNVNPGSFVEISGSETEEFEQPKVNVKINNQMQDAYDVIFRGETLEAYFTEEVQTKMLGDVANMKTYGDSEVSIRWVDCYNQEVSIEEIKNAAPTVRAEYQMKVVITPNVAPEDAKAVAAAQSMGTESMEIYTAAVYEDSALYHVDVVTGKIEITKKIEKDSYEELDGDPIFTYKVTNLEDGTQYYRTVRFDVNEEDTCVGAESDSYYTVSAEITDLPQGVYRVEELDTMGFELAVVSTNSARTNCNYANQNTIAVYALGYVLPENVSLESLCASGDYSQLLSNPEDGHLEKDCGSSVFVNEKVRTSGKETDTDVVKNALVVGETFEGNYNADNVVLGNE